MLCGRQEVGRWEQNSAPGREKGTCKGPEHKEDGLSVELRRNLSGH